ncbi:MAG: WD40 repeat domain-containing protein [Chloroflexi bacterium]|nr:WD40 repeat domain-containing protein [Chloroflexota bacterium]
MMMLVNFPLGQQTNDLPVVSAAFYTGTLLVSAYEDSSDVVVTDPTGLYQSAMFGFPHPVSHLAHTHGLWFGAVLQNNTLYLSHRVTGETHYLLPDGGARLAAVSPDTRMVAIATADDSGRIHIYDMTVPEHALRVIRPQLRDVRSLAWRDSDTLAIAGPDGLEVHNVRTRALMVRSVLPVYQMAWASLTGPLLTVGDGRWRIWEYADNHVVREISYFPEPTPSIAPYSYAGWLDDGDTFAMTLPDGRIDVYSAVTGELLLQRWADRDALVPFVPTTDGFGYWSNGKLVTEPIPALPLAEAQDLLALFDPACESLCLFGIEPGITTSYELRARVERAGGYWNESGGWHGVFADGMVNDLASINLPRQRFLHSDFGTSIGVWVQWGVVQFIYAPINTTLDAIIGAFGYPESVNDDSGELWLMYNQLGLYFELELRYPNAGVSVFHSPPKLHSRVMPVVPWMTIEPCAAYGEYPCLVPTATPYPGYTMIPSPTNWPTATPMTITPTAVAVPVEDPITAISWNATGEHVFAVHESGRVVVDRSDGVKITVQIAPCSHCVTWSKTDADHLLFIAASGGLRVLNLSSLEVVNQFDIVDPFGATSVAVDPTGTRIAVGTVGANVALTVYDLDSGAAIVATSIASRAITRVTWSPGGEFIGAMVSDFNDVESLHVWQFLDDEQQPELAAVRIIASVTEYLWGKSADTLVTAHGDELAFWHVPEFERQRAYRSPVNISQLQWAPEDRLSYNTDGGFRLYFYEPSTNSLFYVTANYNFAGVMAWRHPHELVTLADPNTGQIYTTAYRIRPGFIVASPTPTTTPTATATFTIAPSPNN